jgi:hypothetical protein
MGTPVDGAHRRFRLLLFALGIVVGLAAGLYYAWMVNPIIYVDPSPTRILAAGAPAATPTIDPVHLPLPLPAGLPITPPALAARPVRPTGDDRVLTPGATPTPAVTPAGALPRYQLLTREQLCPPETEGGRIELLVVNADGTPQPGIAIAVTWQDGTAGQQPGGADRLVTGFKPGGYGDFVMQPDVTYTVVLPDGRTTAGDLRLETCANGQTGSWRLIFQKDEG